MAKHGRRWRSPSLCGAAQEEHQTTNPPTTRLIGIAITSGADAIAIATATTTACAIQLPTSVGFGLSESLTGSGVGTIVLYSIYIRMYIATDAPGIPFHGQVAMTVTHIW
ncbi:GM12751 [Drosophila sechellia]|uniref:GM12751 n=1 Tax=Drosophila sechellia TaxID=7238 RepID=B4HZ39_DROSE|nr:GM12751 [Drosophila sechellia]